jgi:hypothetical protein
MVTSSECREAHTINFSGESPQRKPKGGFRIACAPAETRVTNRQIEIRIQSQQVPRMAGFSRESARSARSDPSSEA